MRKRFSILALALVAVMLFSTAMRAAGYTMVGIPKLRSPWFNQFEKGLLDAGEAFDIYTYIQAPASADEAEQVRIIQDAINQGVDAVLVVPNNATSLEPVFARAQRDGILVLTHESPDQGNANFNVEMIDNVKFGETAMRLMAEAMGGKGKFVIFVGSLTVPAHNIWADAALAYAAEHYPELELVGTRYPVSEDQNAARQTATEILTANPDVKGFLAFGSQGAPGAAQAVRDLGLKDSTVVLGTTSPNQARQYLEDGSMDYSVLWDPGEAAYVMIYLAKLTLDGRANEIYDGMTVPGVGEATIEGINVLFDKPLIITKDNAGDYDF